ncbi:uncharacterized protein METZ01_LOCUS492921, partial [marine metagenome]
VKTGGIWPIETELSHWRGPSQRSIRPIWSTAFAGCNDAQHLVVERAVRRDDLPAPRIERCPVES